MIRFIDLFAGVGGIRLGFELACSGFGIETQCVMSSEINTYAQETYELNFGEKPQGDIYKIKEIPEFDFLLAGFPCQPFSYAGRQRGFVDTRGTLFFEIERILREHRPKGFLLENVRGLTTHDQGRTFKSIVDILEALDYKIAVLLLNSSNFGLPQNRIRVYIVGLDRTQPKLTIQTDLGAADSHKFKQQMLQQNLFRNAPYRVVRDILETHPDPKYQCSKRFVEQLLRVTNGYPDRLHGCRLIDSRNGNSIHSWEIGLKGICTDLESEFMNMLIANRRKKCFGSQQDGKMLSLEQIKTFFNHPEIEMIIQSLIDKGYLKEVNGKFNPVAGNMSFEVFKFLDPDSIAITLVSSDAHKLGIVENGRIRRITPRECARLQGFPDTFKCHPKDVHAYRQFGNSVSVPVIRAVISDLFKNTKAISHLMDLGNTIEDQAIIMGLGG